MIKRLGIGCAGFIVIAIAVIVGLVYLYGPVYGANIVGRPVFLGKPSPEKYVESVLRVADQKAIYRDSPEYGPAREAAVSAASQADSYKDIYAPLDAALKAAGGKHSGISSPQDLAEHNDASPAQSPSVTVSEGDAKRIVTATVPGVSAFDGSGQEYADTLGHGLSEALETGVCAVVVDLRGNTGGDMGPMLAGLSPLLDDGTVLEFYGGSNNVSAVTVSGGAVSGGGSPTTVENITKHRLPVALLTDDMTASSGEAVLASFAGLDHVRTFGSPTAGYASANHAFEMPDGAQVRITTLQFRDRTGHVYEEAPIAPDVETPNPDEDARAWLREQC